MSGRPYSGHARAQRRGGHHAGGHGRRLAARCRPSYASGPSDLAEEDWGFPFEDDDEEPQFGSDFDGGPRHGGTPPPGRHGTRLRRRHPSGSPPPRRSGLYPPYEGPGGHERGYPPGFLTPGCSRSFSHRPPGHYGHIDEVDLESEPEGYTSDGNPIFRARQPGRGQRGPGGRAHRGNRHRLPPEWQNVELDEDSPDYEEIEAYIRERDRLEDEELFGSPHCPRHGNAPWGRWRKTTRRASTRWRVG